MAHPCFTSQFRIGIIGGGQLGKMLIQPAQTWNVNVLVLDPASDAPARNLCPNFRQGSIRDYQTVLDFGREADLITVEIEHVNIDALLQLKGEGKIVHPDPEILRCIQDKGTQKQFFKNHGIPTPHFEHFDHPDAILTAVEDGTLTIPFVQKLRREGYDGRGVLVVRTPEDLNCLLNGSCLVEELVSIHREIAVLSARNPSGETICYPAVEMEFHPEANIVEMLVCPVNLTPTLEKRARDLAVQTIEAFGLCGLLAVEMFINSTEELLVNEVAPRPHNCGHHTIETAYTSQYEQHLRAILDLPLGSTRLNGCAAMINLLGADGCKGEPIFEGIEECLKLEGSHIHIYGKQETRPFRKMGHVTVMGATIDEAREKAALVKQTLRIRA